MSAQKIPINTFDGTATTAIVHVSQQGDVVLTSFGGKK